MSTESSGVFVLENDTLAMQDEYIIEHPPYELSLTVEELIAPGKKTIQKSRVKSRSSSMMSYRPQNPPRQQNPFILFRKNYHARRRRENQTKTLDAKDISSEISKDWEQQKPIIKYFFEALARRACQRHEADYPGYKYTPKRNENRGERRKFRSVESSNEEEARKVNGGILVERGSSSPNSPNSQISEMSESDEETITEQSRRRCARGDERKDELKKNEEESLTVVEPKDIVQSQSVNVSSSLNNYLLIQHCTGYSQISFFPDANNAPRSYSPQIKVTPQSCMYNEFIPQNFQTFTEPLTNASAGDSGGQVSANYYSFTDSQLGNFENFELEFEPEQHLLWSSYLN